MEQSFLPDVILQKINDYVSDLFFQDHAKKFNRTLKSIVNIHSMYIRSRISSVKTRKWKIRYNNGIYNILRYNSEKTATHWLHVYGEVIDGRIPKNEYSEWYTVLNSF